MYGVQWIGITRSRYEGVKEGVGMVGVGRGMVSVRDVLLAPIGNLLLLSYAGVVLRRRWQKQRASG